MKIISRTQAKEQSLIRYYTGKPCKHGHDSERYTRNGGCVNCSKVQMKTSRIENRQEYLRKRREYRADNAEKIRKKDREYVKRNREKELLKYRKYYNKHREKIRERESIVRSENREYHNERARTWRSNNADRVNRNRREMFKSDPLARLSRTCGNAVRNILKQTGEKKL